MVEVVLQADGGDSIFATIPETITVKGGGGAELRLIRRRKSRWQRRWCRYVGSVRLWNIKHQLNQHLFQLVL